ncbi:hypothetical protein ACLOJK_014912 [Asimina triloba]
MANHRISSVFLTLEHQAENPSDCRSEIQARQPSTIFPASSDPSMVGATAKPTRSSDHGAAIGACLSPDQRVDPTISGRAIPITIDQGSSIPSKSSRPSMAINDRSPPVAHLKPSAIEPDQRPDPASSQASTPDHAPITHRSPASERPTWIGMAH